MYWLTVGITVLTLAAHYLVLVQLIAAILWFHIGISMLLPVKP